MITATVLAVFWVPIFFVVVMRRSGGTARQRSRRSPRRAERRSPEGDRAPAIGFANDRHCRRRA